MEIESAVLDRYSKGAEQREAALCCPVDYDPKWLKVIPKELLEKDYGCGDPTPHLRKGDTVLDLGSGGGKICYIAAQKVGATGKVIGVDMNDEMLNLARKYQQTIGESIGFHNVSFLKGKIQDLKLNVDQLETRLRHTPVKSMFDLTQLEAQVNEQKETAPLIANDSIDCVVSNCVLNLVSDTQKPELFREIFRVLRRGGRIAISDIVADEPVPTHLKEDKALWSGCISGAMTETGFLEALTECGFYGAQIDKRDETPWQVVEGIEFRSVTVTAKKGKEGACWDRHQSVIYRGPFSQVADDDGHTYQRGERMAVCEKTFNLLKAGPYSDNFYFVEPRNPIALEDAKPFDCHTPAIRSARVTKGEDYRETTSDCQPGCC